MIVKVSCKSCDNDAKITLPEGSKGTVKVCCRDCGKVLLVVLK